MKNKIFNEVSTKPKQNQESRKKRSEEVNNE